MLIAICEFGQTRRLSRRELDDVNSHVQPAAGELPEHTKSLLLMQKPKIVKINIDLCLHRAKYCVNRRQRDICDDVD